MANIAQLPLNTHLFTSSKEKLDIYLPSLSRHQKDKDFVLNCDSSEWKLPEYNSLYDNHLKYFFANPKVRSLLVKTGMIDGAGNIAKDRSKVSNFPCSSKIPHKLKLDPLPENKNLTIQRISLPYRARKPKNKPLSYAPKVTAPIKRAMTLGSDSNKPKTIQSMISKGRSLASMRNVQPMSKDQLAEIFAKYQMKSVKPSQTSGTDDSTVAEEGGASPNERKSDFSSKSKPLRASELEERKITNSSLDILNSNKKDNDLSEHETKEYVLNCEEASKEEMVAHLNDEGEFDLHNTPVKGKIETEEEIPSAQLEKSISNKEDI